MSNVGALRARSVPNSAGRTLVNHSSGTTGKALEYLQSTVAGFAGNCLLHRVYEIFDFDMAGTFAHITFDGTGASDYPHGSLGRGWNFTVPDAPMFSLNNHTPAAEQLEWLERIRPDYVMSYANSLLSVAEVARRRGGATVQFKAFISAGELLEPATRVTIEEVFGCKVIDVYGSREFGPIAFQCPVGPGYHVCSESLVCELLDKSGRPAKPGQDGRVVVTSLYNFAMPFIRYDLADFAVVSDSRCRCGRGLPTLERVAGRVRHLFVMPDGSRKWPMLGLLWGPLSQMLSYSEIQLVQSAVEISRCEVRPGSWPPRRH